MDHLEVIVEIRILVAYLSVWILPPTLRAATKTDDPARFGQKDSLHPQLLEYITTVKLYFNLEFDKTAACPMDVFFRFYYDTFYTPGCMVVGLYLAFGSWWLFLRIGGPQCAYTLVHIVTCGKYGSKDEGEHNWRKELRFHNYQARRSHWMVYLYIYAPLTRKCSSMFFCRDDIEKQHEFMKTDLSVDCSDPRCAPFVAAPFVHHPLYFLWVFIEERQRVAHK